MSKINKNSLSDYADLNDMEDEEVEELSRAFKGKDRARKTQRKENSHRHAEFGDEPVGKNNRKNTRFKI